MVLHVEASEAHVLQSALKAFVIQECASLDSFNIIACVHVHACITS